MLPRIVYPSSEARDRVRYLDDRELRARRDEERRLYSAFGAHGCNVCGARFPDLLWPECPDCDSPDYATPVRVPEHEVYS